jgi:hypothetical protein
MKQDGQDSQDEHGRGRRQFFLINGVILVLPGQVLLRGLTDQSIQKTRKRMVVKSSHPVNPVHPVSLLVISRNDPVTLDAHRFVWST